MRLSRGSDLDVQIIIDGVCLVLNGYSACGLVAVLGAIGAIVLKVLPALLSDN